jgi:hypothetical protein
MGLQILASSGQVLERIGYQPMICQSFLSGKRGRDMLGLPRRRHGGNRRSSLDSRFASSTLGVTAAAIYRRKTCPTFSTVRAWRAR